MARKYQRYNKEVLEKLVKECPSFAEIARRLGKSPVGGTISNIKLMCIRWNIDTSSMTGQSHNKGKKSKNMLSPEQRLVMGDKNDHRISAHRLRKSLFEIGIEHKCNHCGISTWNDAPLILEIDHIDGLYWNNTKENLQFLCPNCHSQKTYAQLVNQQT